jgi:hypothetical protein
MKIKVYPLVSSLHNQNVVDNSTKGFLSALETKLNCSIEIERDVDKLYDNSDLSLLLIQTGGSENYFLRDKSKLKTPILLLTYGFSNSLAAAIEILSYINQNNMKGEILHGSVEYISKRINEILKGENDE